jgi:hypothetical protein
VLDAAWVFGAFLVLVVLAAGGLAVRRILLDRGGGTVECGLRRPGGAWRLGVAAYGARELRWYDSLGVRLSPEEVLQRRTLTVLSRRQPEPAEAARLGQGKLIITCDPGDGDGTIDLAMGEAALTGFLAWLESAPPGSYPLGPLGPLWEARHVQEPSPRGTHGHKTR